VRLLAATRVGIALVKAGGATEVWRGDVRCLARVGARVYAGTDDAGVLRSDDDGATWRAVGLEGVAVRSLGADADRVVAGAQPAAVYRSDDGGASWCRLESFPRRPYWWQPATAPHRLGYVSALAVRGDVILAGIEAFRGFRSADAGGACSALRRGEELRELPHALACPAPNTIAAGLRDGTIIASTDRGETWRRLPAVDGVRSLV